MGIMLDIAGALFVRGTIIVVMFVVTTALNDALYFKTALRTIQTDLSSTAEVVESDFAKMGYNVTISYAVIQNDTSSISFVADVNNDGIQDTVAYYLSDTTALTSTPNPRDRLLYRRINSSQPLVVGQGVTRFDLRYYGADGSRALDPSLISSIDIELRVQHGSFTVGDEHNGVYPEVTWKRRIYPQNL